MKWSVLLVTVPSVFLCQAALPLRKYKKVKSWCALKRIGSSRQGRAEQPGRIAVIYDGLNVRSF